MPAIADGSGTGDCDPVIWAVIDASCPGAIDKSFTVTVKDPEEVEFTKLNVFGVLSKSTNTPPKPFSTEPLKRSVNVDDWPPVIVVRGKSYLQVKMIPSIGMIDPIQG